MTESAASRARRRAEVFAAFRGRCAYCMTAPADHLDHVVPRAAGGTDSRFNLVAACTPCGLSKGSKSIAAWVRALAAASTPEHTDAPTWPAASVDDQDRAGTGGALAPAASWASLDTTTARIGGTR